MQVVAFALFDYLYLYAFGNVCVCRLVYIYIYMMATAGIFNLYSRESQSFGFGDEEVYFYKFQSTAKTGWYKSYNVRGDTFYIVNLLHVRFSTGNVISRLQT